MAISEETRSANAHRVSSFHLHVELDNALSSRVSPQKVTFLSLWTVAGYDLRDTAPAADGAAIRAGGAIVLDERVRFFQNSASLNGSESGGGLFPARFFVSSGPANPEI